MVAIYFADGTTKECESIFQSDILAAVEEDCIEEITEIECYSLEEDEEKLVNEHPDARFYQVFDDVCGAWKQPLYIFAVEDNMNTKLHIEIGHTLKEWETCFGENDSLWDVSIDDIQNGAIEPNPDCWYWLIDGRLYETNIEI